MVSKMFVGYFPVFFLYIAHNFITADCEYLMSLATFLVDFSSFIFLVMMFLLTLGEFFHGIPSPLHPMNSGKQRKNVGSY